MSFAGLSAIGPGYQQGQMNLQAIQQKAQQIQQMQIQLDAAKRETAAQAALFQNLPQQVQPPGNAAPAQSPGGQAPGMGSGSQPQPPMPGQASQPNPNAGWNASTGPQQAPQPQMAQAPQQPQGGGVGAQPGDLSPQAQMQLLTQIAQSIKQRSPGIDPLTLFEAVKQQIGLMGALSNTQKQQLVLAADQIRAQVAERGQDIRAQTSEDTTSQRVAAQERGQDIGARNTDVRVNAMLQATQARIADADNRLSQTQAAINARQDKSIQGRATNKVQSERLALLRTQLSQAKQKLSAASAAGDQGAIQQAQQGVDAAYQAVLQFQQKVSGGQVSQPAAGGGDGSAAPKYSVGQTIDHGGKKYRITGGDLNNDPDVVEVQ